MDIVVVSPKTTDRRVAAITRRVKKALHDISAVYGEREPKELVAILVFKDTPEQDELHFVLRVIDDPQRGIMVTSILDEPLPTLDEVQYWPLSMMKLLHALTLLGRAAACTKHAAAPLSLLATV